MVTTPTLGQRIAGLWIHEEEPKIGNEKLRFLNITIGERRLRIFLETKKLPDSPDASLWVKSNTNTYIRVTGLWLRETKKGATYYFLPLQEGNFRVFLNQRRDSASNQPDYTLYQYTGPDGEPLNQNQEEQPILF